jgi:hypothetical protein
MKRYVVLMAVAALMVAAMAVPAFAAPQGQVERGPEHAKSICSYSGLNDEPDDPVEGGQTQSYGQEVKKGNIEPSETKSGPPSPGFFCNPNNLSLK